MPIYDLRCSTCGLTLEVIVLGGEAVPTACPECLGRLRRLPGLFVTTGRPRPAEGSTNPARRSCGHMHACRCAVKLDRPNPFAARLERPTGS